jgi:hypothetical protein
MKSARTIITLSEEDKKWLEIYSRTQEISMAEAIRQGISRLRNQEGVTTYKGVVRRTKGIWGKEDGLDYQKKIRSEWSHR